MTTANETGRRLCKLRPTGGLICSVTLPRDYAGSTRTNNTRSSQWRTWVSCCKSEDRAVIPVTEADMVPYVR